MFGVDSSEFLLLLLVALVVIGPKDLPRVLRVVGKWVGKARSVAAQFRSGFDDMVRESELAELEKKWKEETLPLIYQSQKVIAYKEKSTLQCLTSLSWEKKL